MKLGISLTRSISSTVASISIESLEQVLPFYFTNLAGVDAWFPELGIRVRMVLNCISCRKTLYMGKIVETGKDAGWV